jgi:hypothetical protein
MTSGVASSRPTAERARSKPAGWDRTRLGVLLPLCVVVAVAIVCIVVAALTSAQCADEVAVAHDRLLLSRAITNHSEWSLARLRNVVGAGTSVGTADIDRNDVSVRQKLATWLGPLLDHDLVLVFDSAGKIVYTQIQRNQPDRDLISGTVPWAQTINDFLQGKSSLPDGVKMLTGGRYLSRPEAVGALFLLEVYGRLCVVAAISLADSESIITPTVMSVRFIGGNLLAGIAERLQLPDLRILSPGADPENANVYEILDSHNQPMVRFAWRQMKPGAEIHLFLRAAGVHCMQGYRFGAPTEPAEITARLAVPGVYRSIASDARVALAG